MIFSKRIRMLAATAILAPSFSYPLMAQDQSEEVPGEEYSESQIVELPEEGNAQRLRLGNSKEFAGQKVHLGRQSEGDRLRQIQFRRNITLAVNYEGTPVGQKRWNY